MTALKILLAVLGAAACLIPFLALTEEYERDSALEPTRGRVVAIEGDVVRYERHDPGSQWDDDGDGWVGPYTDDDVPAAALATLTAGTELELRGGELELSRSAPSKLLLVGFVLCLLFGGLWVAQPILGRRQLKAAAHDPVLVIEIMIRRTRTKSIVVGLLMLVIGVGIAGVAVAAGGELWEMAFLIGLGAISALVAVPGFMTAWSLRNVERAPVLDAILNQPTRIVWVYEHILTVNGIDQHNVHLRFVDGERFDFNLGDTAAAPLIDALRARLPHAAFGYSERRERQWVSAPDCFLQSEANLG